MVPTAAAQQVGGTGYGQKWTDSGQGMKSRVNKTGTWSDSGGAREQKESSIMPSCLAQKLGRWCFYSLRWRKVEEENCRYGRKKIKSFV